VFDIAKVEPPMTVELTVLYARATRRITKPNGRTLVADAGDLVTILAVYGAADPSELPTTGKIWLLTLRQGAIAVDASLFAGNVLTDVAPGTQRFTCTQIGTARRNPQESGTRTKDDAQVVDCYCLQFSAGLPIWIDMALLSTI
jgi:hypothetical protein